MNRTINKVAVAISFALCGLANAQTETFLMDNQLEITGLNDQTGYELRLRLPQGELKTLYINPAKSMTFDAADFAINQFQDGFYKYELLPLKTSIKKTRTDQAVSNEKEAPIFNVLAGTFTVLKGSTLIDQDEPTRDQVINDDLIVNGSACIGQDCVNGESFGFDTLRLKENNLRIRFMDTSTSASFPTNDWELTANDSANGGANKFSITDIDGGRVPFTIEAGAPTNSLFVESSGDIGFGTNNPVVKVHLADGDSPSVRLEQNGTSGWTPQIWDVAGNETNFFIRDVTNGSTLPFRIRPAAPSSSIFIDADGDIGLGTASPNRKLHLRTSSGSVGFDLEKGDTAETWKFIQTGNEFKISKVGVTGGAQISVSDTNQFSVGSNLVMDASGNVTILGALTQNSDVHSKENIVGVNTSEILSKVMAMPISIWNYKFDDENVKHLGPMAQDFFKQFNLGGREDKIATIDTSGVALASIKELGKQLSHKEQEISQLKTANDQLNERLKLIEIRLAEIDK